MRSEMEIAINLDSYINIENLTPDDSRQKIIDDFTESLDISSAIETLCSANNSRNTKVLTEAVGEDDVVIIFSNYFYDVWEKINILTESLGFTVICCDSRGEITPQKDLTKKVIKSNIVDIFNFLRTRKRMDNVLYLSVNAVWRHVLPYLIRSSFSEIKIISYMYDWLSLFCPYKHRKHLQGYLGLSDENIESEYEVYNRILKGEIVNGILYKDGGENISVLKNYSLPRLCMPVFLPESLHQKAPYNISQPNKFVYMGKLVFPDEYGPDLFRDAYFAEIVKAIDKKNYHTDLYYVRTSPATLDYYKKALMDSRHVNLFEGKPLDELLPAIAGKYHWGYLINNYTDDYKVYGGQVEIGLPSRIFTYIALNIPVVLSKQLTFAAEYVTKNGLGIAVSLDDLPYIDEILKGHDYNKLLKNISDFRERHSFEIQKNNFSEFVQSVMYL
jgi:hypothetical protein